MSDSTDVIVIGAVGAFLGDNTAYGIGRRFAHHFERRATRKAGFRKRLQWAHNQLETRGGPLLITARFIPGGVGDAASVEADSFVEGLLDFDGIEIRALPGERPVFLVEAGEEFLR